MARIKERVGPKGPNKSEDVLLVQQRLNVHRLLLGGLRPPAATGQWNDETAAAILAFQREGAALAQPDGIIDPGGYTMTALEKPVIVAPQHRIFSAVCWAHPNDVLSDADFRAAATDLACEVAAIRAVAETEARDEAWDREGRPIILFERHKFARHSGGLYNRTHRDISNPTRGGYGPLSRQYPKLRRAAILDETAALKSASWGLFQILGENHADAGYSTVGQFVDAMLASRSNHLKAFVAFVKANSGMLRAIRNKDWATFARLYNGPAYRDNDYDGKMSRAYQRLTATPARTAAR